MRPAGLEKISEVARLPAADLEGPRTARMERAPERRARRIGHLASGEVARNAPAGIRLGYRAEQRLRVWVLRILVDRLRRPDLDDSAEVEDRDPVAEELRRRKVVRDVEVRELELVSKIRA